MANEINDKISCTVCGETIPFDKENCPSCGAVNSHFSNNSSVDNASTEWKRERDRLKNLLVLVVAFFWFSVIFQASLYYLDGTLNLILLSIISAMIILGVVLKTRLQLHMRKIDR